jgi:hypothetical protein
VPGLCPKMTHRGAKLPRMKRARTPSFVAEFPLRTTRSDEETLSVRLEAARQIYNASLGEALRRLGLLRESRRWQEARAMPKGQERRDLFKESVRLFEFGAGSIQKFAERCRDACWIGRHLGSHDTQTTSLRAFRAAEQHAFGKRGRPRFKGLHRLDSVEGKGDAVLLLRVREGVPVLLWDGLVLPLMRDPRDKDGWGATSARGSHEVRPDPPATCPGPFPLVHPAGPGGPPAPEGEPAPGPRGDRPGSRTFDDRRGVGP